MAKKQKKESKSLMLSPEVDYWVVDSSLVDGTEMRSGFIQKFCPKCGSDK